jgi:DNA-binding beta-propeller fold protein YncE
MWTILIRVIPLAALLLGGSHLAGDEPKTQPARFLVQWGSRGNGLGEFDFPIGIVVGRDGDVFVTDFYNARVQRFDTKGKYLASFDVLPNPGGIARDADGNFFLTHFSAMKINEVKKPDRVSVYSPDGKLIRQWGKTGTGDGEFDYPGGTAVGPNGHVYVADQTNRRVQVFDAKGKFLFKWGEYGTKHGQFGGNITPKSRVGGPQFLAIDGKGNVYTTEGSVGRVQKFSADGKFLHAWGTNDDKAGGFGGEWLGRKGSLRGPVAICVDEKGHLWVSAVSGRVQEFTNDGVYLRGLGSCHGSKPGEFQAPHGVALDGRGHIYVVDAYNHRLQKFAIGP